MHRTDLDASDVRGAHGIRITTPARTLADLAADLGSRALERAWADAERRRLAGRAELRAVVARLSGRPGIATLRAMLSAEPPAFTRSEAEERLLALVRRGGLPSPETNVPIDDYELDFLWRRVGVVVEVDGFAFHAVRGAFEADRRRDAHLLARGLGVMRITWRQIVAEPEATLARLAAALALAGAS